jgi:hypothetical protein
MFALLCCLASCAISFCQHNAARTPACLFAVIATPFALPQINIPKADSLLATLSAVGQLFYLNRNLFSSSKIC